MGNCQRHAVMSEQKAKKPAHAPTLSLAHTMVPASDLAELLACFGGRVWPCPFSHFSK
jgi:hypothetical protein